MRLYLPQLSAHLTAGPASCYLIFGDASFLCQEACDLVLNVVTHAGTDVQRLHIEKGFDWDHLLQDMQTVDLFAPQKVMVLTLLQKPDAAMTKGLTNIFAQLPQGYTLVVVGHYRLTKAQTQAKWFTAIEQKGVYIPTNAPEGIHLQRWIQHRLQQANLQVTPDALEWLCLAFSGNLATAANEIEKLGCMQLPLPLLRSTLMQHVTAWSHFSVFDWVDALLNGDAKRGLAMLNSLFQDEQEPSLLLWTVTKEMERLAQVEYLKVQGIKPAQMASQLKIWQSRMCIYDNALNRLGPHKRQELWHALQQVDRANVAFDKEQAWQLLRHITLLFCQDIQFSLHL